MKRGYEYAQKNNVAPLKKWVGKWAPKAQRTANQIEPVHLALVGLLSFIIGVVLTLSTAPPEFVRSIQRKEYFP